MLQRENNLSHSKSDHQKQISNLFSKKSDVVSKTDPLSPYDSLEIYNRKPKNKLPKNAIKCFTESYILKKGMIITTGIDVFIASKDAQAIRNGTIENFDDEINKIANSLGHNDLVPQIKKIFKWAAEVHYDNEKDVHGNLECQIDFVKILTGKHEIKIGKNWYTLPPGTL